MEPPAVTNVETHFARIPLDRVVRRPGDIEWTDGYHHNLDEFAGQILEGGRRVTHSFRASVRNVSILLQLMGPEGVFLSGQNNGGHRLAAAILLGLDAVYGNVRHQRIPSVRSTNSPSRAIYWSSLLEAGLVEGKVVYAPTPNDRDELMQGDYKFHIDGAVAPWILDEVYSATSNARAYETWFPGSP